MTILVPHFSSQTCEWSTPLDLFKKLDDEFKFTLDPCATKENAKCEKFFTIRENGLAQSWEGERVFVNPPYGNQINKWVKKAYEERLNAYVVMLLPARTDTRWWHNYVYWQAELRFLKGRLKFGGVKNPAPFPSVIAIFPEPWNT
jgi:site-specific DNA-methyltransferase (adenine-specific)